MRTRTKVCEKCSAPHDVLYRCSYQLPKHWVFLCGACLKAVKVDHAESYQYGGTWKSRKK